MCALERSKTKETLPNKIFLCKQWLEKRKTNIKYWQFGNGN